MANALHVDEVGIVLDKSVDDFKEKFIAEDGGLVHLDIVGYNLIENLVIDEDLLVVTYEINDKVDHHVHIDVGRGI